MLAGLKDKLMAPDVAAEAMRAYQEERNRMNRERRLSGDQDRRALEKAEKAIKEIVAAIEDGRYSRTLGDRLAALEKEQDALGERLGHRRSRRGKRRLAITADLHRREPGHRSRQRTLAPRIEEIRRQAVMTGDDTNRRTRLQCLEVDPDFGTG